MWYDALEVAKYIISVCTQQGKPISNLKLQKVLYFVWVDFYKMTGRKLFLDDICAWQLGPVVPIVYYEYCPYAGRPISRCVNAEVETCDKERIDQILESYMDIPACELVDRSHVEGSPWDIIYQNGKGNRDVIPFSLIIDKEVS